jgi:hypothetical protein
LVQIKLRGFLSHIQQVRISYWGISSVKAQSMRSPGLSSPRPKDSMDENEQPAEASVIGRSWVQSMFSRDPSRANSFGRVRKGASDGTSGLFFHSNGHLCYNNFVYHYITLFSFSSVITTLLFISDLSSK